MDAKDKDDTVGSASALVTFICVFCTLRAHISRSEYTHYNLTINLQLYTLQGVEDDTGVAKELPTYSFRYGFLR